MLDKKGHVKLIDFGLSKMNMGSDTLTNTFCGTGKLDIEHKHSVVAWLGTYSIFSSVYII